MIRPLHVFPLLVLLAACSRSAGPAEVTVRDSAGITIIEHPAGAIAAAPAFWLGDSEVTIGGGEGEDQEFSFIGGALRLGDGRILLADNESGGTRFMVYGADGTFERRLGRAGDGPGEFRNAMILGRVGDTLLLYDFMAARLSRMGADGTLHGTAEFARLGPMNVGMPSGALGDGTIFTTPMPFRDTADHGAAPYRRPSALQRVDPATGTLDTLQVFPGDEVKLTEMTMGGQTRSIPTPVGYGKRTLFAYGADRIHVATNATAEVTTFAFPWAPVRMVRFAERAIPVDQAARDALMAEAIANVERATGIPEEFKRSAIESFQKMGIADSIVHFQGMLVGTDGSLWLRQGRTAADSVPHYIVIGAEGRLAGRLDLPTRGRLLWTDGAVALISTADENDLPRVELRPVRKGTVEE